MSHFSNHPNPGYNQHSPDSSQSQSPPQHKQTPQIQHTTENTHHSQPQPNLFSTTPLHQHLHKPRPYMCDEFDDESNTAMLSDIVGEIEYIAHEREENLQTMGESVDKFTEITPDLELNHYNPLDADVALLNTLLILKDDREYQALHPSTTKKPLFPLKIEMKRRQDGLNYTLQQRFLHNCDQDITNASKSSPRTPPQKSTPVLNPQSNQPRVASTSGQHHHDSTGNLKLPPLGPLNGVKSNRQIERPTFSSQILNRILKLRRKRKDDRQPELEHDQFCEKIVDLGPKSPQSSKNQIKNALPHVVVKLAPSSHKFNIPPPNTQLNLKTVSSQPERGSLGSPRSVRRDSKKTSIFPFKSSKKGSKRQKSRKNSKITRNEYILSDSDEELEQRNDIWAIFESEDETNTGHRPLKQKYKTKMKKQEEFADCESSGDEIFPHAIENDVELCKDDEVSILLHKDVISAHQQYFDNAVLSGGMDPSVVDAQNVSSEFKITQTMTEMGDIAFLKEYTNIARDATNAQLDIIEMQEEFVQTLAAMNDLKASEKMGNTSPHRQNKSNLQKKHVTFMDINDIYTPNNDIGMNDNQVLNLLTSHNVLKSGQETTKIDTNEAPLIDVELPIEIANQLTTLDPNSNVVQKVKNSSSSSKLTKSRRVLNKFDDIDAELQSLLLTHDHENYKISEQSKNLNNENFHSDDSDDELAYEDAYFPMNPRSSNFTMTPQEHKKRENMEKHENYLKKINFLDNLMANRIIRDGSAPHITPLEALEYFHEELTLNDMVSLVLSLSNDNLTHLGTRTYDHFAENGQKHEKTPLDDHMGDNSSKNHNNNMEIYYLGGNSFMKNHLPHRFAAAPSHFDMLFPILNNAPLNAEFTSIEEHTTEKGNIPAKTSDFDLKREQLQFFQENEHLKKDKRTGQLSNTINSSKVNYLHFYRGMMLAKNELRSREFSKELKSQMIPGNSIPQNDGLINVSTECNDDIQKSEKMGEFALNPPEIVDYPSVIDQSDEMQLKMFEAILHCPELHLLYEDLMRSCTEFDEHGQPLDPISEYVGMTAEMGYFDENGDYLKIFDHNDDGGQVGVDGKTIAKFTPAQLERREKLAKYYDILQKLQLKTLYGYSEKGKDLDEIIEQKTPSNNDIDGTMNNICAKNDTEQLDSPDHSTKNSRNSKQSKTSKNSNNQSKIARKRLKNQQLSPKLQFSHDELIQYLHNTRHIYFNATGEPFFGEVHSNNENINDYHAILTADWDEILQCQQNMGLVSDINQNTSQLVDFYSFYENNENSFQNSYEIDGFYDEDGQFTYYDEEQRQLYSELLKRESILSQLITTSSASDLSYLKSLKFEELDHKLQQIINRDRIKLAKMNKIYENKKAKQQKSLSNKDDKIIFSQPPYFSDYSSIELSQSSAANQMTLKFSKAPHTASTFASPGYDGDDSDDDHHQVDITSTIYLNRSGGSLTASPNNGTTPPNPIQINKGNATGNSEVIFETASEEFNPFPDTSHGDDLPKIMKNHENHEIISDNENTLEPGDNFEHLTNIQNINNDYDDISDTFSSSSTSSISSASSTRCAIVEAPIHGADPYNPHMLLKSKLFSKKEQMDDNGQDLSQYDPLFVLRPLSPHELFSHYKTYLSLIKSLGEMECPNSLADNTENYRISQKNTDNSENSSNITFPQYLEGYDILRRRKVLIARGAFLYQGLERGYELYDGSKVEEGDCIDWSDADIADANWDFNRLAEKMEKKRDFFNKMRKVGQFDQIRVKITDGSIDLTNSEPESSDFSDFSGDDTDSNFYESDDDYVVIDRDISGEQIYSHKSNKNRMDPNFIKKTYHEKIGKKSTNSRKERCRRPNPLCTKFHLTYSAQQAQYPALLAASERPAMGQEWVGPTPPMEPLPHHHSIMEHPLENGDIDDFDYGFTLEDDEICGNSPEKIKKIGEREKFGKSEKSNDRSDRLSEKGERGIETSSTTSDSDQHLCAHCDDCSLCGDFEHFSDSDCGIYDDIYKYPQTPQSPTSPLNSGSSNHSSQDESSPTYKPSNRNTPHQNANQTSLPSSSTNNTAENPREVELIIDDTHFLNPIQPTYYAQPKDHYDADAEHDEYHHLLRSATPQTNNYDGVLEDDPTKISDYAELPQKEHVTPHSTARKADRPYYRGDHINFRYEVLALIAIGESSRVFKCLDHKTSRMVAVKLFNNDDFGRANSAAELISYRTLIQSDIRLILPLPNIIDVFKTLDTNATSGIVFNYYSITLSQWFQLNPFYAPTYILTQRITQQLLTTIGFMHFHNIIHNDIKLSNILFVKPHQTAVKLADLSSSSHTGAATAFTITLRTPERLFGERVSSPMTDIFALGLLVLEIFLGFPLIDEEMSDMDLVFWFMTLFGKPQTSFYELYPDSAVVCAQHPVLARIMNPLEHTPEDGEHIASLGDLDHDFIQNSHEIFKISLENKVMRLQSHINTRHSYRLRENWGILEKYEINGAKNIDLVEKSNNGLRLIDFIIPPAQFYSLHSFITACVQWAPNARYTARELLNHPFMTDLMTPRSLKNLPYLHAEMAMTRFSPNENSHVLSAMSKLLLTPESLTRLEKMEENNKKMLLQQDIQFSGTFEDMMMGVGISHSSDDISQVSESPSHVPPGDSLNNNSSATTHGANSTPYLDGTAVTASPMVSPAIAPIAGGDNIEPLITRENENNSQNSFNLQGNGHDYNVLLSQSTVNELTQMQYASAMASSFKLFQNQHNGKIDSSSQHPETVLFDPHDSTKLQQYLLPQNRLSTSSTNDIYHNSLANLNALNITNTKSFLSHAISQSFITSSFHRKIAPVHPEVYANTQFSVESILSKQIAVIREIGPILHDSTHKILNPQMLLINSVNSIQDLNEKKYYQQMAKFDEFHANLIEYCESAMDVVMPLLSNPDTFIATRGLGIVQSYITNIMKTVDFSRQDASKSTHTDKDDKINNIKSIFGIELKEKYHNLLNRYVFANQKSVYYPLLGDFGENNKINTVLEQFGVSYDENALDNSNSETFDVEDLFLQFIRRSIDVDSVSHSSALRSNLSGVDSMNVTTPIDHPLNAPFMYDVTTMDAATSLTDDLLHQGPTPLPDYTRFQPGVNPEYPTNNLEKSEDCEKLPESAPVIGDDVMSTNPIHQTYGANHIVQEQRLRTQCRQSKTLDTEHVSPKAQHYNSTPDTFLSPTYLLGHYPPDQQLTQNQTLLNQSNFIPAFTRPHSKSTESNTSASSTESYIVPLVHIPSSELEDIKKSERQQQQFQSTYPLPFEPAPSFPRLFNTSSLDDGADTENPSNRDNIPTSLEPVERETKLKKTKVHGSTGDLELHSEHIGDESSRDKRGVGLLTGNVIPNKEKNIINVPIIVENRQKIQDPNNSIDITDNIGDYSEEDEHGSGDEDDEISHNQPSITRHVEDESQTAIMSELDHYRFYAINCSDSSLCDDSDDELDKIEQFISDFEKRPRHDAQNQYIPAEKSVFTSRYIKILEKQFNNTNGVEKTNHQGTSQFHRLVQLACDDFVNTVLLDDSPHTQQVISTYLQGSQSPNSNLSPTTRRSTLSVYSKRQHITHYLACFMFSISHLSLRLHGKRKTLELLYNLATSPEKMFKIMSISHLFTPQTLFSCIYPDLYQHNLHNTSMPLSPEEKIRFLKDFKPTLSQISPKDDQIYTSTGELYVLPSSFLTEQLFSVELAKYWINSILNQRAVKEGIVQVNQQLSTFCDMYMSQLTNFNEKNISISSFLGYDQSGLVYKLTPPVRKWYETNKNIIDAAIFNNVVINLIDKCQANGVSIDFTQISNIFKENCQFSTRLPLITENNTINTRLIQKWLYLQFIYLHWIKSGLVQHCTENPEIMQYLLQKDCSQESISDYYSLCISRDPTLCAIEETTLIPSRLLKRPRSLSVPSSHSVHNNLQQFTEVLAAVHYLLQKYDISQLIHTISPNVSTNFHQSFSLSMLQHYSLKISKSTISYEDDDMTKTHYFVPLQLNFENETKSPLFSHSDQIQQLLGSPYDENTLAHRIKDVDTDKFIKLPPIDEKIPQNQQFPIFTVFESLDDTMKASVLESMLSLLITNVHDKFSKINDKSHETERNRVKSEILALFFGFIQFFQEVQQKSKINGKSQFFSHNLLTIEGFTSYVTHTFNTIEDKKIDPVKYQQNPNNSSFLCEIMETSRKFIINNDEPLKLPSIYPLLSFYDFILPDITHDVSDDVQPPIQSSDKNQFFNQHYITAIVNTPVPMTKTETSENEAPNNSKTNEEINISSQTPIPFDSINLSLATNMNTIHTDSLSLVNPSHHTLNTSGNCSCLVCSRQLSLLLQYCPSNPIESRNSSESTRKLLHKDLFVDNITALLHTVDHEFTQELLSFVPAHANQPVPHAIMTPNIHEPPVTRVPICNDIYIDLNHTSSEYDLVTYDSFTTSTHGRTLTGPQFDAGTHVFEKVLDFLDDDLDVTQNDMKIGWDPVHIGPDDINTESEDERDNSSSDLYHTRYEHKNTQKSQKISEHVRVTNSNNVNISLYGANLGKKVLIPKEEGPDWSNYRDPVLHPDVQVFQNHTNLPFSPNNQQEFEKTGRLLPGVQKLGGISQKLSNMYDNAARRSIEHDPPYINNLIEMMSKGKQFISLSLNPVADSNLSLLLKRSEFVENERAFEALQLKNDEKYEKITESTTQSLSSQEKYEFNQFQRQFIKNNHYNNQLIKSPQISPDYGVYRYNPNFLTYDRLNNLPVYAVEINNNFGFLSQKHTQSQYDRYLNESFDENQQPDVYYYEKSRYLLKNRKIQRKMEVIEEMKSKMYQQYPIYSITPLDYSSDSSSTSDFDDIGPENGEYPRPSSYFKKQSDKDAANIHNYHKKRAKQDFVSLNNYDIHSTSSSSSSTDSSHDNDNDHDNDEFHSRNNKQLKFSKNIRDPARLHFKENKHKSIKNMNTRTQYHFSVQKHIEIMKSRNISPQVEDFIHPNDPDFSHSSDIHSLSSEGSDHRNNNTILKVRKGRYGGDSSVAGSGTDDNDSYYPEDAEAMNKSGNTRDISHTMNVPLTHDDDVDKLVLHTGFTHSNASVDEDNSLSVPDHRETSPTYADLDSLSNKVGAHNINIHQTQIKTIDADHSGELSPHITSPSGRRHVRTLSHSGPFVSTGELLTQLTQTSLKSPGIEGKMNEQMNDLPIDNHYRINIPNNALNNASFTDLQTIEKLSKNENIDESTDTFETTDTTSDQSSAFTRARLLRMSEGLVNRKWSRKSDDEQIYNDYLIYVTQFSETHDISALIPPLNPITENSGSNETTENVMTKRINTKGPDPHQSVAVDGVSGMMGGDIIHAIATSPLQSSDISSDHVSHLIEVSNISQNVTNKPQIAVLDHTNTSVNTNQPLGINISIDHYTARRKVPKKLAKKPYLSFTEFKARQYAALHQDTIDPICYAKQYGNDLYDYTVPDPAPGIADADLANIDEIDDFYGKLVPFEPRFNKNHPLIASLNEYGFIPQSSYDLQRYISMKNMQRKGMKIMKKLTKEMRESEKLTNLVKTKQFNAYMKEKGGKIKRGGFYYNHNVESVDEVFLDKPRITADLIEDDTQRYGIIEHDDEGGDLFVPVELSKSNPAIDIDDIEVDMKAYKASLKASHNIHQDIDHQFSISTKKTQAHQSPQPQSCTIKPTQHEFNQLLSLFSSTSSVDVGLPPNHLYTNLPDHVIAHYLTQTEQHHPHFTHLIKVDSPFESASNNLSINPTQTTLNHSFFVTTLNNIKLRERNAFNFPKPAPPTDYSTKSNTSTYFNLVDHTLGSYNFQKSNIFVPFTQYNQNINRLSSFISQEVRNNPFITKTTPKQNISPPKSIKTSLTPKYDNIMHQLPREYQNTHFVDQLFQGIKKPVSKLAIQPVQNHVQNAQNFTKSLENAIISLEQDPPLTLSLGVRPDLSKAEEYIALLQHPYTLLTFKDYSQVILAFLKIAQNLKRKHKIDVTTMVHTKISSFLLHALTLQRYDKEVIGSSNDMLNDDQYLFYNQPDGTITPLFHTPSMNDNNNDIKKIREIQEKHDFSSISSQNHLFDVLHHTICATDDLDELLNFDINVDLDLDLPLSIDESIISISSNLSENPSVVKVIPPDSAQKTAKQLQKTAKSNLTADDWIQLLENPTPTSTIPLAKAPIHKKGKKTSKRLTLDDIATGKANIHNDPTLAKINALLLSKDQETPTNITKSIKSIDTSKNIVYAIEGIDIPNLPETLAPSIDLPEPITTSLPSLDDLYRNDNIIQTSAQILCHDDLQTFIQQMQFNLATECKLLSEQPPILYKSTHPPRKVQRQQNAPKLTQSQRDALKANINHHKRALYYELENNSLFVSNTFEPDHEDGVVLQNFPTITQPFNHPLHVSGGESTAAIATTVDISTDGILHQPPPHPTINEHGLCDGDDLHDQIPTLHQVVNHINNSNIDSPNSFTMFRSQTSHTTLSPSLSLATPTIIDHTGGSSSDEEMLCDILPRHATLPSNQKSRGNNLLYHKLERVPKRYQQFLRNMVFTVPTTKGKLNSAVYVNSLKKKWIKAFNNFQGDHQSPEVIAPETLLNFIEQPRVINQTISDELIARIEKFMTNSTQKQLLDDKEIFIFDEIDYQLLVPPQHHTATPHNNTIFGAKSDITIITSPQESKATQTNTPTTLNLLPLTFSPSIHTDKNASTSSFQVISTKPYLSQSTPTDFTTPRHALLSEFILSSQSVDMMNIMPYMGSPLSITENLFIPSELASIQLYDDNFFMFNPHHVNFMLSALKWYSSDPSRLESHVLTQDITQLPRFHQILQVMGAMNPPPLKKSIGTDMRDIEQEILEFKYTRKVGKVLYKTTTSYPQKSRFTRKILKNLPLLYEIPSPFRSVSPESNIPHLKPPSPLKYHNIIIAQPRFAFDKMPDFLPTPRSVLMLDEDTLGTTSLDTPPERYMPFIQQLFPYQQADQQFPFVWDTKAYFWNVLRYKSLHYDQKYTQPSANNVVTDTFLKLATHSNARLFEFKFEYEPDLNIDALDHIIDHMSSLNSPTCYDEMWSVLPHAFDDVTPISDPISQRGQQCDEDKPLSLTEKINCIYRDCADFNCTHPKQHDIDQFLRTNIKLGLSSSFDNISAKSAHIASNIVNLPDFAPHMLHEQRYNSNQTPQQLRNNNYRSSLEHEHHTADIPKVDWMTLNPDDLDRAIHPTIATLGGLYVETPNSEFIDEERAHPGDFPANAHNTVHTSNNSSAISGREQLQSNPHNTQYYRDNKNNSDLTVLAPLIMEKFHRASVNAKTLSRFDKKRLKHLQTPQHPQFCAQLPNRKISNKNTGVPQHLHQQRQTTLTNNHLHKKSLQFEPHLTQLQLPVDNSVPSQPSEYNAIQILEKEVGALNYVHQHNLGSDYLDRNKQSRGSLTGSTSGNNAPSVMNTSVSKPLQSPQPQSQQHTVQQQQTQPQHPLKHQQILAKQQYQPQKQSQRTPLAGDMNTIEE